MIVLIRYYKLYNMATQFLIIIPVLVNIYIVRALSTSQTLFIEAVYCITIMIFELPMGYLGDRIGYDKLVIIGLSGTVVGYTLFAFSHTIMFILLSQVLLGIFCSCMSGSDIASLSTCLDKKPEISTIRVHKSIFSTGNLSLLVAYLASGFVIRMNYDGTFILLIMAIAHLCAIVFFIMFYQAKRKFVNSLHMKSDSHFLQEAGKEYSNKKISYFDLILCGIILSILSAINLIAQIFFINTGLDSYYYGMIYCTMGVLTIIIAKTKWTFNKRSLFCLPFLFAIPIFNFKLMIIPFAIFLAYSTAVIIPFVNDHVSRNSKKHKALNLSISNLINKGISGVLMFTLSGIVYMLGFSIAMAVFTIVATLIIVYFYRKSSQKLKYILKSN